MKNLSIRYVPEEVDFNNVNKNYVDFLKVFDHFKVFDTIKIYISLI